MNKKRNVCIAILLFLALCAIFLLIRNHKSKEIPNEAEATTEIVATEATTEFIPEATTEEKKLEIPVDFKALKKQNPDIYAWIRIPDTKVDYPILHSTKGDVDYYLNHTVDGVEGLPGSIYTQYNFNPHLAEDRVTVVYGHNMKNESMFGSLKHYKEKDYRKKHPIIYIYTAKHIYTYKLMATVTYTNDHIMYQFDGLSTEDSYQSFLDHLKENGKDPSWYRDPFDITKDDQMLILSTCNGNEDQRFFVCGKLIEMQ